jgi:hypothetical protein
MHGEFMPDHEHEYKTTLTENAFYPDHANPRAESATFRHMKHDEKALRTRCCISGQPVDVEYHHIFCEWAWSDAVDWHVVHGIALGIITHLPVLDLITDQPTDELYPVEQSLVWMMIQITKARGFDWAAFDPNKPETFVDSWQNMLPLHKKFHRGKQHGAHETTAPIWGFQMFPRRPGFIFSPDEMNALHGKAA